MKIQQLHKGIASDSNSICLWHESEDINKEKGYFQKFQLIPILHLEVVHDYVHWHCSIDSCFKLILIDENLCENCSYITENDFCLIPLRKCASWRRATNRCQKFKFWNFESALYIYFIDRSFWMFLGNSSVTSVLWPSWMFVAFINMVNFARTLVQLDPS